MRQVTYSQVSSQTEIGKNAENDKENFKSWPSSRAKSTHRAAGTNSSFASSEGAGGGFGRQSQKFQFGTEKVLLTEKKRAMWKRPRLRTKEGVVNVHKLNAITARKTTCSTCDMTKQIPRLPPRVYVKMLASVPTIMFSDLFQGQVKTVDFDCQD